MKKNEMIRELINCRAKLRKDISEFMAEKDYEKCKSLLGEIDISKARIVELEKTIKES